MPTPPAPPRSPVPTEPEASGVPAPPVLAEVVRSGFVEGHHRGALVVLKPDGTVGRSLGDVTSPCFPRSSNKPMQAVAALRSGVELSGERLALAAASHSGESFHQELVRRLLAEHGLTEDALRCPPALPGDRDAMADQLASGAGRTRVAMNCSGKHAGMLAACAHRGWPLESYLAPDHPLQVAIGAAVAEAAGEPVAHTGVDGCGAPVLAFSLTGLARAFQRYVTAPDGSPERRVADAMRAHPEYVAGTGQLDTVLMSGVSGVLAKGGAEGVQAVALADGHALALKLDDGAARARGPVVAAVLRDLGVSGEVLDQLADEPLYGGEERVGGIRAVL